MDNNIYIILFILLILIFLFIINRKKNIENFTSDPWTTNKDILALEKAPLNDTQKEEVKNMITSITNSQLKTLIATQSPLLKGPQGIVGPQGPPGTQLVASGRLVNKSGSYDKRAIVWCAEKGIALKVFLLHSAPVLDVDWKDSDTFATCSSDMSIP
jgi:hypothetical protein